MPITRRTCLSGLTGVTLASVSPRVGVAQTSLIRPFSKIVAAPRLALPGLDGAERGLADRPALVAFWAVWCAPCRAELPALLRLQDDLAAQNITVFAVNVGDPPERVRGFLGQIGAGGLNVLLDRERVTTGPWRVGALPVVYGVSLSGNIGFSALGAVDWDDPEARRAVAGLLEKPAAARSPA